jgi:DNA-directed RNA polymerase subunit alpha
MRIRWRNLELPSRVSVERSTLSKTYGKFVIEPFERGFGHTIGNGLRRVLLSSIEGTAVRWIKLHGAVHEFQSVDGVVEDVTDIVLQLKQVLIRIPGDGPVMIKIDKKSKGPVTAADIVCEGDAEVANPDLHICTLWKDMDFHLEAEVARGRGYTTAEENEAGGGRHSDAGARRGQRDVEQEIGKIWIDSIFSPVLRVKYATEDTRVGKLTDYDKLTVEVWTDGTVRPEEALSEASKIYRKFLNPLCSFGSPGAELPTVDLGEVEEVESSEDVELRALLDKPITELDLSVRSGNCLEAERIFTVGDLVRRSADELLAVRNFGKTSLTEIEAKLSELGLSLAGSEPTPSI